RFQKLGIRTVRDLLWHIPVRYDDYSEISLINEVEPGKKVNIQGQIVKMSSRRIFPRHLTIVNAVIKDSTGAIRAVWFNQPYIANTLIEGTRVSLAGKIQIDKKGLYLSSPIYEKISEDPSIAPVKSLTHTARLVPIYSETDGISSKYLRFLIQPLLQQIEIEDPLPPSILQQLKLPLLGKSIRGIHFPQTVMEAEHSKERLAFNDLLFFQLKALLERRKYNQLKSVPILFDKEFIQDIIAHLPFKLTRDQKIAAWEILQDLEKSYPMNRLLEGDVGSGKTAVALIAAIQVARHKAQSVLLAPTEVLANQHFKTISQLIPKGAASLGLITSSGASVNGQSVSKQQLKKMVRSGEIDICIGTHAVIQRDVNFNNLALVIIDEQHRFGIKQRSSLIKTERSTSKQTIPHLLSMTATPIPRTLALTIFGDLDISILKEKPKDRQPIITRIISSRERSQAHKFIREQISSGRQVFVICPRIDVAEAALGIVLNQSKQSSLEQLWSEVKAVEAEFKRLSEEIFPDLKIAKLHGKMKAREKQQVMDNFKKGQYDILVATSVIEVGIDIPNATLMVIEGAERFGLAQLHQFRGRVGRAAHQSYCFLFPTGDKSYHQRLKAFVESDDGFALAEKDMALRGPGEFFGLKQSGVPDLTMTALTNMELIKKARMYARFLLKEDSSLQKYPVLKQQLETFQRLHHFE
ncbi:MAG TPA: ATP-dependent DNA helicase RecG, partial [Candidatus Paceibacterota bacterium]|nr:ATP-dependent DNA helicase RecG [Candidatus Paceibacterota bacterium]